MQKEEAIQVLKIFAMTRLIGVIGPMDEWNTLTSHPLPQVSQSLD